MTDENHFWRINVGHILSILTMLAGVVIFFISYDHQIRDNTSGLANHVLAQIETNKVTNDRLKTLEESRMTIGPKLERIDEKLNWITDWINEQKANRPISSTRGK